jgi:nicotinamidase-related amidase
VLRLPLRYQAMLSSGPHDNVEANIAPIDETYEVDPSQAALVLVDTWNKHHVRSHKDRTADVMRERIAPLLPELRGVGIPLIYAPSPEVAHRYPQWEARFGGRSPHPGPLPEGEGTWPPRDLKARFPRRSGEMPADYDGPLPSWWHWDAVHESIAPHADDHVVARGAELHELLSELRRDVLFYVGFAANICVLHRDYGILAMGARGYLPVLLRDCTTAIETRDTLADFATTRLAIQDVERRYFTADSTDLIEACQAHQGAP